MGRFYKRRNSFKLRRGLKRKRSFKRRRNGRVFKRRVRRVVETMAEHKYIDYSGGTPATNAGTIVYFLDTLAQGDTSTSREGASVKLRSLKINLIATASNADKETFFRVIFGVWKDFYVTSPNPARILEVPTSQTLSPYLRENLQAKKWIPMYDKKFTLDKMQAGATRADDKVWSLSFSGKRLPMKKITYSASGVADHVYFLMVITSFVGLPGNEPQLAHYARATFVDF